MICNCQNQSNTDMALGKQKHFIPFFLLSLTGITYLICPIGTIEASRWQGPNLFQSIGYDHLYCENRVQTAACCACKSIIKEVEQKLNSTTDDHMVKVSFRMGVKRYVRYSRSEPRIEQVVSSICNSVPLDIPKKETRIREVTDVYKKACENLLDLHEDDIVRAFFNVTSVNRDDFCNRKVKTCEMESYLLNDEDEEYEDDDEYSLLEGEFDDEEVGENLNTIPETDFGFAGQELERTLSGNSQSLQYHSNDKEL